MTTRVAEATVRGITWDHPRGRHALEAAAADARSSGGPTIAWEAHSLEHFESHPIDDLARRYDLVVLDHPHLGEALAHGSLRPLDDLIDPELLAAWAAAAVGPTFASYAMAGRQWALPLDAATQVAVRRAGAVDPAPDTWDEVDRLASRGRVALSLAGPHAFLTFASVCVALGRPVGELGDALLDHATASTALDIMRAVGARAPGGTVEQNPIALLERMVSAGDVDYCPLVYGYVTYSGPLDFCDAPAAVTGGRRGSTLGGTGLAVSAHATVAPALLDHLAWLMSPAAQDDFVPRHSGQPARRTAWTDPVVDAEAHGFYGATLATLDRAWVRPRHDGYIAFQSLASRVVREVVAGERSVAAGIAGLEDAARSTAPDPGRS